MPAFTVKVCASAFTISVEEGEGLDGEPDLRIRIQDDGTAIDPQKLPTFDKKMKEVVFNGLRKARFGAVGGAYIRPTIEEITKFGWDILIRRNGPRIETTLLFSLKLETKTL